MSTTLPLINSITIRTATSQITYSSQASESSVETPAGEAKGVEVNLSSAGKAAAASSSRNADIEQSGLPASVQKILKAIRELQRRIAEDPEGSEGPESESRGAPHQGRGATDRAHHIAGAGEQFHGRFVVADEQPELQRRRQDQGGHAGSGQNVEPGRCSYHPGELLPVLPGQVRIEDHAHSTHQQPA